MRFLICLSILMFGLNHLSHCEAQIFTVLWYHGKRIDDTTLVNKKGQMIKYSRKGHRVIINTPSVDDLLAVAIRELKNSPQRKQQLNQLVLQAPGKKINAAYAPHINKAIDDAQKRFSGLENNIIELPKETVKPGEGSASEQFKQIPANIESAYQQVMNYIGEIRSAAIERSPEPPSVDFDYCYACDKERQAKYEQDSINYMKYIEREQKNLTATIEVIHLFDLMKVNQIHYDTERGSVMLSDMYDAMQIILNRIGKKLTNTWNAYLEKAPKIPFLISQLLGYIHSCQLIGLDPVASFPKFTEIMKQSIAAAKICLSDALSKNDFKILLNMQWVVSLYRMAEMLGMSKTESDKNLMDFININRFKVSIDAKARMNKNGGTIAVNMTGDNYFRAVPDSNCVLQWTLTEPDASRMEFDLREATMQSPDVTPIYTGTKKWKSYPAGIKLDFCKEERDTALLFGFSPLDGKETWMAQGQNTGAQIVATTLMLCFIDVERMQGYAADPTLKARMEKEIMEKSAQIKATMPTNKDPSTMTPQELAKLNAAMNETKAMMNDIKMISPFSFLFKGQLKNMQKTVFDETLNGKELIPQNTAITEALFRLKIEHVE